MFKISKSDYVLGVKCPNAIWFKKLRKDIQTEMNMAILERGHEIGRLAIDKFPGGRYITAKPWEYEAATQTQDAIQDGFPYIYEATLSTKTGEYCAVDILRNNNDGTWDIIEVKSTTSPHEYHYLDASFQKYVFTQCGVKIRDCYIMTLNPEYVRHGALDIQELFVLHNVNEELQPMEQVAADVARIRAVLDGPELGIAISKGKCNKFYDCPYKHHCWRNIPDYSVFNAFKGVLADEMYAAYGANLANIPEQERIKQMHPGDIEAYLTGREVINPDILRNFTDQLQWPLYFLDYESIMPAVPMFDNSKPYQQICFQFSLHVQRTPGGELEHYEYLHNESGTDPRPGLIKKLIETIGTTGSVIVYNQPFEQGRNTEMARDFPEYADQLLAINDRMLDLLTPFRERGLYRPCQNGSASIKQTLPAFVPEMSYENLGIHNGTEASDQFMNFMIGKQTPAQTAEMMQNLHEYCGQDTIAMVQLLEVVQRKLQNQTPEKQELFEQAQAYIDRWYREEDEIECVYHQLALCEEERVMDPDVLEDLEPTFSQKLFELIRKQGISETDCYKNANIDRRLFSKIRSDDEYQPKKNTVFALIFGLKLNLTDAEDLLDAAGYSISHSLKMDVLVEFLIKKKIYDLITVNEVLYKYGCPLLGGN